MERAKNIFGYLTYSIIIYSLVSCLISLSLWLDMRIHSRYVCYGVFIIAFVFLKLKSIRSLKFLILMDLLFLIPLFMGKFNRIAFELRDAFYIPLSINIFKILLIIILLLGNFLMFFNFLSKQKTPAN